MRALQIFLKANIPPDWETIKLKKVAHFNYGFPLPDALRIDGDYPVYGSNGIVGYHNSYKIEGRGIVIGRKGTAGKVVWTKKNFYPIDTTFYITPIGDDIDLKWLYYLLSIAGLEKFSGATGVPGLSRNDAHLLMVPKPSHQEQQAIANILTKVDDTISAIQSSIVKAERVKKSLMQNLLTGKLKADGNWRRQNEFYIDEKYGSIPLGWSYVKLKGVLVESPQYGANASAIPYADTLPRFIRISDIDDFGNLIPIDKVSLPKEEVKGYTLEDDDFLFARTGDTVGKSLLYKREMGPAVFAGYLIRMKLDKKKILPEYLKVIALSDIFEAYKVAMQRIGAKPNINAREYGNFKFPLPDDIIEQQNIYSMFQGVFSIIVSKQNKIKKLERVKKALMQNLLTGKVRVRANESIYG